MLGIIEYQVQGENEFEGAFIATNERLIMNVDMNGQFYYRSISYNEIEKIDYDGQTIMFKFILAMSQCMILKVLTLKCLLNM